MSNSHLFIHCASSAIQLECRLWITTLSTVNQVRTDHHSSPTLHPTIQINTIRKPLHFTFQFLCNYHHLLCSNKLITIYRKTLSRTARPGLPGARSEISGPNFYKNFRTISGHFCRFHKAQDRKCTFFCPHKCYYYKN